MKLLFLGCYDSPVHMLQSYILLLFDVDILQDMAYARNHCEQRRALKRGIRIKASAALLC